MRATLITFTAALTLAACGGPAPERPSAPPAASPAVQSPPLMQGMGNHHHAIATTSPEAQRYFDQGFDRALCWPDPARCFLSLTRA
jgi:hypothetical protein